MRKWLFLALLPLACDPWMSGSESPMWEKWERGCEKKGRVLELPARFDRELGCLLKCPDGWQQAEPYGGCPAK